MRIVKPFQVVIGLISLLGLLGQTVLAEEPTEEPTQEPPSAALVAVPSFFGELPDGTTVYAIIVIPAENVLRKNAAWQAWEAQWPTRYRVAPTTSPEETSQTNSD